MKEMKTNEKNRILSDRQIKLNEIDMLYEILGNMKGKTRKIWYEKDEKTLYFYNDDDGFTDEDKEAIQKKNQSGNNNNTAGLNGFGIRLVIDRLLPEDKFYEETTIYSKSTIYSLNDKHMCNIGHFNYNDWRKYERIEDTKHSNMMDRMKIDRNKGSFFAVPINETYDSKFQEKEDDMRKSAIKFYNILLNNNSINFFWKEEKQTLKTPITPTDNAITIEYELGYFVKQKNSNDSINFKTKPLYLKITNTDIIEKIKTKYKINITEYTKIKDITEKYFSKKDTEDIKDDYEFITGDKGKLILNIVPKDYENNDKFKFSWLDGHHVIVNNQCLNLRAIKKRLIGIEQTTEFKPFNGRPRIENHISKNTIQYYLPTDKTSISLTIQGEHVMNFINCILKNTIKKDLQPEIITEQRKEQDNDQEHEGDNESEDDEERDNESEDDEERDNEAEDHEEGEENIIFEKKDKKRCFTSNEIYELKKENMQYYQENCKDTNSRCPMCQRLLYGCGEGGHIQSYSTGGKTELNNGLIICKRCNNNDKRNIFETMIDEYGLNHRNTKDFIKMCKHLNKDIDYDHFINMHKEKNENTNT